MKHVQLEYRVDSSNARDTWNCPDPIDHRRWVPVARFTYFQEALDYCAYAQGRGVTVRLRGPYRFERIYDPADGAVAKYGKGTA
jgi:hypothetical protein